MVGIIEATELGWALASVIGAGLGSFLTWLRRHNNDQAEVLASASDAIARVAPFWEAERLRQSARIDALETQLAAANALIAALRAEVAALKERYVD